MRLSYDYPHCFPKCATRTPNGTRNCFKGYAADMPILNQIAGKSQNLRYLFIYFFMITLLNKKQVIAL